jgi:hypothetical protein
MGPGNGFAGGPCVQGIRSSSDTAPAAVGSSEAETGDEGRANRL